MNHIIVLILIIKILLKILDANGYLEVFFHVGEIDVVYDEFTSNKSNLFKEKLFLKDIEIAKDNFIIIDRR